eukprot:1349676-Rhodomonas_salina.1
MQGRYTYKGDESGDTYKGGTHTREMTRKGGLVTTCACRPRAAGRTLQSAFSRLRLRTAKPSCSARVGHWCEGSRGDEGRRAGGECARGRR